MKSSVDFYKDLAAFGNFNEITEDRHYMPAPEDWFVVITDVAGSTKAIAEGRYKSVNLVGASSIIAVVNSLPGHQIPYVFGGDGATLLVHSSDLPKIKPALLATQRMAKDTFNLEIRAGAVALSEIMAAGKSVEVAKYRLSSTATLAMIRGGGLNLAEKLIKSSSNYALTNDFSKHSTPADFNGLSCRWNAIASKKGEIVSLLVLAMEGQETAPAIYRQVLTAIEEILGDDPSTHPVNYESISERKMSGQGFVNEIRLRAHGQSLFKKVLLTMESMLTFALVNFFIWMKIRSPVADTEKYVREMAAGSDFRKFDDMVRMVRDCTFEQRQKIGDYLEALQGKGQITYGMHVSSYSLVTCYVASLSDHVHFVDGSDGGYAMAAKQLKQQLAKRTS